MDKVKQFYRQSLAVGAHKATKDKLEEKAAKLKNLVDSANPFAEKAEFLKEETSKFAPLEFEFETVQASERSKVPPHVKKGLKIKN
jgi:hypothetical protein